MKRSNYIAPKACVLSGLNVSGEPEHTCYAGLVANDPSACGAGSAVGTDCGNGAAAVASCAPTGMFFLGTSPCVGGSSPTTNECATGSGAIVASCTSGSMN